MLEKQLLIQVVREYISKRITSGTGIAIVWQQRPNHRGGGEDNNEKVVAQHQVSGGVADAHRDE
ncbi:hypothetical protein SCL_1060 [Sulfuricaulis limicola]|uniref:Uncharacterized protein n=1 Tax=Sulfuricaulis limicola TaxID=1620215 RepID=A0A1B4XEZ7_9GAMM|nr:hypothetical protein SCL_1060 [Sulfuricaulis limicola]